MLPAPGVRIVEITIKNVACDFVVETHIVVAQNTGLRYGKKRVNTGGKCGFVFSFRPSFLRGNTGN
ncbi:hypothetical protein ExPCM12_04681 [Escherichia coli]|nr:hypothetical protein ExPCM12_04681 [Escherichia coli]GDE58198.1 hypothetical protein HmCmsJML291_00066 [Escherichia coli]